jgi:septum formation protein
MPGTAASVPLILASTSPYRRALLEKLGIPFEVVAPGVDETPLATEKPDALASRLAMEKARAVASHSLRGLVIGSDQVAMLNDIRLSKPHTRENAIAHWRQVMGETDPARAKVGTLRRTYGFSIERNSVHGSDSPQTAETEISYFFEN